MPTAWFNHNLLDATLQYHYSFCDEMNKEMKQADVNIRLNKFIMLARDQHMLTVGMVNTINKIPN